MEEKQILHDKANVLDNQMVWHNTPDPNFVEISRLSRVKDVWLSNEIVRSGKYSKSAIKPVNGYVQEIGHPPKVLSIHGNEVTIRFFLYADMYILKDESEDLGFYHVDRPWMRQYYLTNEVIPDNEYCFNGTFKFFVPWFIDESLEVTYLNVEDSPFLVEERRDYWFRPEDHHEIVTPHMVPFKFKKVGKHMHDSELGIPRRGDPMFDMKVRVSDIILEKIKEEYANN